MKNNFKQLFFILFLTLSSSIIGQRIDFSALEKEVQEAKNSREKADAMVRLGSAFSPPQASLTLSYSDSILSLSEQGDEAYFQNASNYLRALSMYRKGALNQAKKAFMQINQDNGKRELYLRSLNFIGIIYLRTNKPDSGLLILNQLIEETKEEEIGIKLRALGNRGKAYRQLGDYTKSIRDFESCVLLDSTNEFSILNSYLSIASIFGDMEMPEKAIETLRKANIENVPPQPIKAAYFNNIGTFFYESGRQDSAITYLTKGYDLAKSIGQFQLTLKNRMLIAQMNIENQDFENAKDMLDAVRVDLFRYPAPPVRIDFNLTLAKYFIATSQYDSALFYATKVLDIAKPKPMQLQKQNAYELIAKAYDGIGQLEQSKKYFQIYSAYQDSVSNSQREKFRADAKARYELGEKERLIEEAEFDSVRLKQWQIVLLIGVFTLFIVAFILYRRLGKSKDHHQQQMDENAELHKEIERNRSEIIELKSRAVLNVDDIVSIKADGHYLEFNLTSKDKPEVDRNGLKSVLSNLPTKFVQIHRSYIVNVEFIKIKYANKVVLSDGTEIPVSRTYKKELDSLSRSE